MTQLEQSAEQRLHAANRHLFDLAEAPPFPWTERLSFEVDALRQENAVLRAQLHAIQTSTSWRLTAPLRTLLEPAKRFAKALAPSAAAPMPPDEELGYDTWIVRHEPYALARLERLGPGRAGTPRPVTLGLVLLAGESEAALPHSAALPDGVTVLVLHRGGALAGPGVLERQVPAEFGPANAVALALELLDTEMLCFLDARDRLAPEALRMVAGLLAHQPPLDLVFTDEDWLDPAGRRVQPDFKPGWDAELQRGRDLVGPFAFLRTALLRDAVVLDGPAWRYDLANQVIEAARPGRILHIPAVLCHRKVLAPGYAAGLQAAAELHLQRQGVDAQVLPAENGHRIAYAVPQPEPLVSVIVPTRDRPDLLRVCTEGVLRQTDYARLELLIVDNGTTDAEALVLLDQLAAQPRVRVLRRPGPFNWSLLNNDAAAVAAGDILLLLNNDIAVLRRDWLAVLVSHLVQPGVGAGGPKLLYPDGRVQHAGLTTSDDGMPHHLFRYAPGESAGPCGMLAAARSVWAVTGACLAIRRSLFMELGGLNEAQAVACNDIDLCLRLGAHGWRIVWTPWSLLEHRELATRPPDHHSPQRQAEAREELDRLRRDWGGLALHDPWLNANLLPPNGQLRLWDAPENPALP